MSRDQRFEMIRNLFFWIGTVVCLAAVITVAAHNTITINRLEHWFGSITWVLVGLAMLAFLAAEFCNSVATRETTVSSEPPKPASPAPEEKAEAPSPAPLTIPN